MVRSEVYKNSQPAVGWCETICKFVDYLDKVDISNNAPKHQRTRCLNHFLSVATQIFKWVPRRSEKIARSHRTRSSVFEKNKREGRLSPQRIEIGKEAFFLKNHQFLHRHGHTIGGTVTNGNKVAGESTNGGKADERWSYSNWQKLHHFKNSAMASTVRHEPS